MLLVLFVSVRLFRPIYLSIYLCIFLSVYLYVFLREGSYFGERALLSDETRKATCVAQSEEGIVCLSLGELFFFVL